MKEKIILAKNENIGDAVVLLQRELENVNVSSKKKKQCLLSAEELMVQMVEHSDGEKNHIIIQIEAKKKSAKIWLSCKGNEFKMDESNPVSDSVDLLNMDEQQASVISYMILNAYAKVMTLKHSKGVNRAEIIVSDKEKKENNAVMMYMLFGILFGLILRFCLPQATKDFISYNILKVVSTMFINAIKFIVAPFVFFSIAESMTGFSDYKAFGRMGAKIIGLYFVTTAVAILISYGIFLFIEPGDPSQVPIILELAGTSTIEASDGVSIRNILIDIIPSNFAQMFVSANMLQIIFSAIVMALASGKLGEYAKPTQNFFKAGRMVFEQIMNMIVKVMPYAVFCIMANIMLTTGADSLVSLIKVFLTIVLGIIGMMIFYLVFLALVGRINPIMFFAKFKDAFVTAFTTASSSASMPVSMKCLKELGVAPKIYAFSIPLGSTINMDGTTVYYLVVTMFMIRTFGIPMNASMLFSLFITIMLVSVGTPSAPGAAFALTAMIFSQYGIPAGAVNYIMVLATLSDFIRTASNVTGDAVVTTIVAKKEGLLDTTIMKSKHK